MLPFDATVWGLAVMLLFLPFAAMLKVVCEEFEHLITKIHGLIRLNNLFI
jgi:hypothetical protein